MSGLAGLMRHAADAARHMRGRIMVLYGGHDQLVPESAMADMWAHLPADARRDYLPGGYHLLTRGRNRRAVMGDVIGWIRDPDSPLPSGGDVAAAAWMATGPGGAEPPGLLPGRLDGLAR